MLHALRPRDLHQAMCFTHQDSHSATHLAPHPHCGYCQGHFTCKSRLAACQVSSAVAHLQTSATKDVQHTARAVCRTWWLVSALLSHAGVAAPSSSFFFRHASTAFLLSEPLVCSASSTTRSKQPWAPGSVRAAGKSLKDVSHMPTMPSCFYPTNDDRGRHLNHHMQRCAAGRL